MKAEVEPSAATGIAPRRHGRAAPSGLAAENLRLKCALDRARARIARLRRLADQDDLSQLANRRAFKRELARVVDYAERYAAPASVLFLDLDGLKAINDRLGHAAGDAAIRQVGRLLKRHLRASDLVARLGGDEFGVILARADAAAAADNAERLAALIAARPLRWRGVRVALSAAIGGVTFASRAGARLALERADAAMYRRKARGNA
jgi:diguanylate cyclase (GGDEF)-like protein